MPEFTLRNLYGQAVPVYYYKAGDELSLTIGANAVATFEADTLSPSTNGLIRSGVIKLAAASQAPAEVSQSIQVYPLGFVGLWISEFYYERGFVASWNGINWYSKKAHKSSSAPSLDNPNWGYFGVSDIDSLVGINVDDADLYSVLTVGPKEGGGQQWQAAMLSGLMFEDESIQIAKVESLAESLDALMPLSGGTLTGPVSFAAVPTEDEHLINKAYADLMVPLSGATMTGKLYYADDITIDSETQLVSKEYVDAVFQGQLALTGGTMTGYLTLLPNQPINSFHATPKVYVDSKLALAGGTLTGAALYADSVSVTTSRQLVHKAYADAQALAGGTMTGLLTLSGLPSQNYHAAPKVYVDTQALAGGTLAGLLSLPDSIPLVSALNLTPKSYVDGLIATMLAKAGGTMTGALTLSGLPSIPLHAATKSYVDNVLGVSGDVLLLEGGIMEGPILGAHGLLRLNGLSAMIGPVQLASLPDSPQTTAITAVANAGAGTVWLSLASATGWATSQKAVVTGTTDYNGTYPVLEVSASPAKIRVTATFTSTQTGTATATQQGLYRSSDVGDIVYEGRQFITQGRTISVSSNYTLEDGDGLILVDASDDVIVLQVGAPAGFASYPITIRKANQSVYSPVLIKLLSDGRMADLTLNQLGESITFQSINGSWGVIGHYAPNIEEAAVSWGDVLLHTSGQTELDVTVTPQALKITSGAIADGGSGELDITVVDVTGFAVGQIITVEGSRHGHNGDYEILAISGSIISVDAVTAFTVADTCYLSGFVAAARSTTSILKASALSTLPTTPNTVFTISAIASGGSGTVLLTLNSVTGWTTQHSVTVAGTSTYDGTYVVEAVDTGAATLKVTATYGATSTGTATMAVGATVEGSTDQVGKSFSLGTQSASIRSQPTGLLRAKISATADLSAEIKKTYLHVLSGGDLNLYGPSAIAIGGVGQLTSNITSVANASGGSIWLVLGNILGWAEDDEVTVTGTTSYNATYTITEVDGGGSRIKVVATYVATETGNATNLTVVSLVAAEDSDIDAGDYFTVRGASKLGAEVVDVLVDAIVDTTPEVVFTTRDITLAQDGSVAGLMSKPPSKELYLVRPWAWYRHEFTLDTTKVQDWLDISGNGRDLEQLVSGDQPTYAANGVNDYPAVTLTATKNLALAVGKATPITIFIVLKADSATPAADEIVLDGSDGTNFLRFKRLFSTTEYSLTNGVTTITSSSQSFSTTAHVYTLRVNGASSFIRKDGTQIATGTLSTAINDLILGDFAKAASFAGKVPEMQIYNTVLTTDQLQYIEAALINRYS